MESGSSRRCCRDPPTRSEPMTPEALKALNESIEHWKRMRDDRERGESPSATDCALCRQFSNCIGCPVADEVGVDGCQDTPFEDARTAFWKGTDSEWQAAAQKEIDFLEGLK